jgi:hypothetical protein
MAKTHYKALWEKILLRFLAVVFSMMIVQTGPLDLPCVGSYLAALGFAIVYLIAR